MPAPFLSFHGYRYYFLFVDDYTHYTWIDFLHSKDELSRTFTRFKPLVENQCSSTIKTLRTDGGTEYKPLRHLFPQIPFQTTCPYTPQQNGVAQRKHRHIVELALALMTKASIPTLHRDYIFISIVFLIDFPLHTPLLPLFTLYS